MRALLTLGLLSSILVPSPAAQEKPKDKQIPALARMFSPVGTLLVHEAKTWKMPALYDAVPADKDLVTLPGAKSIVDLKEGDVRLTLLGNLPELSTTPVLDSAIVLHASKDLDLELTLARGRI